MDFTSVSILYGLYLTEHSFDLLTTQSFVVFISHDATYLCSLFFLWPTYLKHSRHSGGIPGQTYIHSLSSPATLADIPCQDSIFASARCSLLSWWTHWGYARTHIYCFDQVAWSMFPANTKTFTNGWYTYCPLSITMDGIHYVSLRSGVGLSPFIVTHTSGVKSSMSLLALPSPVLSSLTRPSTRPIFLTCTDVG